MLRTIAAACLLLAAVTLAPAQFQPQPSPNPVGTLPPLPPIPPLPGNVQNTWNGNPAYQYQYQMMQWQLRYPYGPPYYPYGILSGSPYSPYGSPSNPYASGNTSSGSNSYSPGNSNTYAPGGQSQDSSKGGDNRATIRVVLPSTAADVWVDGVKMTDSLSSDRLFVSPPLEPGHKYQYTIKARWPQRLENVTQERTVTVTANRPAVVDFTKATVK